MAPPIKTAENATTFQLTLLPDREVASASSAFDQRAMAAMRAQGEENGSRQSVTVWI